MQTGDGKDLQSNEDEEADEYYSDEYLYSSEEEDSAEDSANRTSEGEYGKPDGLYLPKGHVSRPACMRSTS